jgi:serine protease
MWKVLVLSMSYALLALAPEASAATLHVPGQYPTIQAGMDAAVAGDTVLVACGTYDLYDPILMKSGVTLRSETGTPDCVVLRDRPENGLLHCLYLDDETLIEGISFTDAHYWAAIAILEAAPVFLNCDFYDNHCVEEPVLAFDCSPTFTRCTFRDSYGPHAGGIYFWGGSLTVTECTFWNAATSIICYDATMEMSNCTICDAAIGIEVGASSGLTAHAEVRNSIIAFGAFSIECGGDATASVTCSDIYGNQYGDWVGCLEGQLGIAGNISEDPLFCDPQGGDFQLACTSPCAPFSPPNPECDLIGAWPVGCGGTRVLSTTWGALKALFK